MPEITNNGAPDPNLQYQLDLINAEMAVDEAAQPVIKDLGLAAVELAEIYTSKTIDYAPGSVAEQAEAITFSNGDILRNRVFAEAEDLTRQAGITADEELYLDQGVAAQAELMLTGPAKPPVMSPDELIKAAGEVKNWLHHREYQPKTDENS